MGDQCQFGLEWFFEEEGNPNSKRKCCQAGLDSSFNDCKCLPCDFNCTSTIDAQTQAAAAYKQLGYSEEEAEAASKTYLCGDSIFWTNYIPPNVEPVFKCCESLTADHTCNCPPKDDTKKCYSTWSNPDMYECDFGESSSGELCCRDKSGACRDEAGTVEGWTDWAKCWESSEDDCNAKASKTRDGPQGPQTSGCVYDKMPTQKYCGITVTSDTQCQDARPNNIDNNVGLTAVSDTEWFVNSAGESRQLRRASEDCIGCHGDKLEFSAMQAIRGATGYCGSFWLQPPNQESIILL